MAMKKNTACKNCINFCRESHPDTLQMKTTFSDYTLFLIASFILTIVISGLLIIFFEFRRLGYSQKQNLALKARSDETERTDDICFSDKDKCTETAEIKSNYIDCSLLLFDMLLLVTILLQD